MEERRRCLNGTIFTENEEIFLREYFTKFSLFSPPFRGHEKSINDKYVWEKILNGEVVEGLITKRGLKILEEWKREVDQGRERKTDEVFLIGITGSGKSTFGNTLIDMTSKCENDFSELLTEELQKYVGNQGLSNEMIQQVDQQLDYWEKNYIYINNDMVENNVRNFLKFNKSWRRS